MDSGYGLLKAEPRSGRQSQRMRKKTPGLIAALVLTLACVYLLYIRPEIASKGDVLAHASKETLQCASALPLPASPPAPINLWAPLKVQEAVQVRGWLESPDQALNLTTTAMAQANDNMIYNIEVYRPAKADALAYLASPSLTAVPDRYARVSVHHGGRLEPVVMDYLVGPLPIGKHTTMRRLTEIYHRDDIPYNARGFDHKDHTDFLSRIIPQFSQSIQV